MERALVPLSLYFDLPRCYAKQCFIRVFASTESNNFYNHTNCKKVLNINLKTTHG